jgi:peptidoglycan hydrolase CwlO-like protein
MEEHLKQVVKTSVVNFCSEVQEENQYLSEKVDMLEKQVEKFAMLEKELADTQKQLDRTTSQLNDCATKQQMMELLSQHAVMQELLREQLALREQGKASCRGCTIC